MDYYKRILYQDFADDEYFGHTKLEEDAPLDDEAYVDKMESILSAAPCIGVPPEPSQIAGGVYLGTSSNAENVAQLKSMGIKYLLNCAGGSPMQFRHLRTLYGPETGILGYEELPIEDSEYSDLSLYVDRAHGYIDYARSRGGKVLIYCPGVSRSGAIAISFLVRQGTNILAATRVVKDHRRNVLANYAFVKQLVKWSRQRGMLDQDVGSIRAPRYGRALDRHRIRTAHLPTFL